VPIGRRLLVAPPWDVPEAPGREVLVIEPGMAFGTGQHATTRGCLAAIEDAVEAGGVRSALDVGTGSGILAMALVRLGVPHVVAIDDDPRVLPLARESLARNGAARVALAAGTAAGIHARFDLVVANLLADALLREADALAARVAPDGRLVVSGLLASQAPGVAAAYRGWKIAGEHADEGWSTLVLRRAR
jgi:ribosomal protein L11 methyltransferase